METAKETGLFYTYSALYGRFLKRFLRFQSIYK